MAFIKNANISQIQLVSNVGDPAGNPSASKAWIYVKNNLMYLKTDAGVVVGPFGQGGANQLDELSDVNITPSPGKGSVLAHNGSGEFRVQTVGSNGQILSAQSGQTLGLQWVDNKGEDAYILALIGL